MTDAEVAAVLETFDLETREAILLMRKQLTDHGVTKEPLRTRMACEFAEVLLALRKEKG